MNRSIFLAALSMALAAAAGTVGAAEQRLMVSEIVAQQQQIRAGVQAGSGIYQEMPAVRRQELLTKQAQMLQTLSGKRTTDELGEDQKLQVFNTLEWIEAAVNNAEDERMVCERRAILGSNRKERVCRTVAQMKLERERARDTLDSNRACSDCKSN